MEGGGDGRDSEEDMNPLFSSSLPFESELSSISCWRLFSYDFGIFTIESHQT